MYFATARRGAAACGSARRQLPGQPSAGAGDSRGAVPMGRRDSRRARGRPRRRLCAKLRARVSRVLRSARSTRRLGLHRRLRARRGPTQATWRARRQRSSRCSGSGARLHAGTTAVRPAGRTVIVVDDGLATGATMIAALHAVRAKRPAKLVCAVPVGDRTACARSHPTPTRWSAVATPPDFYAVGSSTVVSPGRRRRGEGDSPAVPRRRRRATAEA